MGMPSGDTVLDARDRAILRFFLCSGARLETACRLKVSDVHRDGDEATIRLHEEGDKRRTIGLHCAAAEAIAEYLQLAGIEGGPLFRPRRSSRSQELADRPMDEVTMWRVVLGYLERLPGSMREVRLPDGSIASRCCYAPRSLRATTATLLLSAGVDIRKVQELLGHRHATTTQIYDKRRRSTSESASHDVPIWLRGRTPCVLPFGGHGSFRSRVLNPPGTLTTNTERSGSRGQRARRSGLAASALARASGPREQSAGVAQGRAVPRGRQPSASWRSRRSGSGRPFLFRAAFDRAPRAPDRHHGAPDHQSKRH
jgi:hypothetical protein